MEFDLEAGRITAIAVPGPNRWMGILKGSGYCNPSGKRLRK